MSTWKRTPTLMDTLARRRTDLRAWANDLGIGSYSEAVLTCANMGMVPPSQAEWDVAFPPAKAIDNPEPLSDTLDSTESAEETHTQVVSDSFPDVITVPDAPRFHGDAVAKPRRRRAEKKGE